MKTQNKKLAFKRSAIVELNDKKMNEISGGTSAPCIIIGTILLTIPRNTF
ncbi:class I lanthipeptide [Pontimicrobium sp. MEBiC01747]